MMKKTGKILFPLIFIFVTALLLMNCKKDKDDDSGFNHTGEEWLIDSVNWWVIDQDLSGGGQATESGTAYNAGSFYFDTDGTGSYDYTVGNYHREGGFNYTEESGYIDITYINQSLAGLNFTQQVISFDGDKEGHLMELDGSDVDQSSSAQFSLTGEFYLSLKQ